MRHPLEERLVYQRYIRSEEIIAIARELDGMWASELKSQLSAVEKFFVQYISSGDAMSFPWKCSVRKMHPLEFLTSRTEAFHLYLLTANWLGLSGIKTNQTHCDAIMLGKDRQKLEAILQRSIQRQGLLGVRRLRFCTSLLSLG